MPYQNLQAWMLTEAVELLQSADRLQRQFFRIGDTGGAPSWEPPVDMYESDGALGLLVALPGVSPQDYGVTLEPAAIVVYGQRMLGVQLHQSAVLRLEIPYGRFERRINLPHDRYQLVSMVLQDGCLRLHLEQLK